MKQLNRIKNTFPSYRFWYLIPTIILGVLFSVLALNQPLHDYANNYFPALLVLEGVAPETVLFDIYDYNHYIWSKGYTEALADFYLNSPFTATLFYPLALVKNAFYSKFLFNLLSVVLFTFSLRLFFRKYLKEKEQIYLLLLPILFYVPLRNNIEFGQVYLLILSLVLLGYYAIDTNRKVVGEILLSAAILTKIFPIFYCIPLIFKRKWKSISLIFISGCVLLSISILVGGLSFWTNYLFEVMPNALLNESTVNFQSNAQSFAVFVKTLLVRDAYYNPNALFDNPTIFKVISWLYSAFFISLAISASFKLKNNTLNILSVWVITLFLIQSRTATYAQLLWLIPALAILKSEIINRIKVILFISLLLICNFPFHWLTGLPLFFEFSRMWLSLAVGLGCLYSLGVRFSKQLVPIFMLVFIPVLLLTLSNSESIENSDYVLETKEYFLIHDFYPENNILVYEAFGKKGNEVIASSISVDTFDAESCQLINGQIYFKNQQLTDSYSLKKKPVLVNNKEIYYLTDHHSRRGAYTLKKITIPE